VVDRVALRLCLPAKRARGIWPAPGRANLNRHPYASLGVGVAVARPRPPSACSNFVFYWNHA